MKRELSIETQQNLIDVLTERPISFTANGKRYALYQPSLGKVLLIQKELSDGKCNFADIPQLCVSQRAICCRLIAMSCLCTRKQLFNRALVDQIAEEMDEALDLSSMVTLVTLIQRQNDVSTLGTELGLYDDDETRKSISKAKTEKSSSIVFGGHSIYGTLIDAACERYGWTLDYLLWDISFANVSYMMKDAINSVYLGEEERKKVRLHTKDYIDANDPANKDRIAAMLKD